MKLYLAGPMRGIVDYNFPAFHAAAANLRAYGHTVFSPAERDEQEDGFDPTKDAAKPMVHYMRHDLPAVLAGDGVAVLPGWEKSSGARLEVHTAVCCGLVVVDAASLVPIDASWVVAIPPTNGGRKDDSDKLRFDLLPARPLEEVARVYTIGAKKYDDRNWEKGIKWSRIFAAMMRHAWAFWRGEQRDPTDGQHHLASVAWCALALMEYEHTHIELDDRPR